MIDSTFERLKVILISSAIYIVFLSSVYLAVVDKDFRSTFRELSFAIVSGCFALLQPGGSLRSLSNNNYSNSNDNSLDS